MTNSSMPLQQPFWRDEPDIQYTLHPYTGSLRLLSIIYSILISLTVIGLGFFLFYEISQTLAWLWLLFFISLFGFQVYLRKQKKLSEMNIAQIQQKAREQSGASVIGSAIHVAGHPLLEREQPVVLAIASDVLKIFAYDDQVPIDMISINQLVAFQTVVYDDERTPHIDTVDSNAQALQVTLKYQDREFTCIFRRMRKVRPIDWYHEFHKAQWQLIHH